MWSYTNEEKILISSLVVKGKKEQDRNKKFAIIELAEFLRLLTESESELVQKYLLIDPKSIGYKLPFIGTAGNTNDLVAIEEQSYSGADTKKINIPCQYMPRNVHHAYTQLNKTLHADIGKKLLVLYGHRSVARQVFIFFDILERIYNFDVRKTIMRVCFPDYSEHVCTKRQAIDFKTEDATVSDDFDKTEEYAWLQANAKKFGFYESYPKKNDFGMMYEPWHWRYEGD